MTKNTNDTVHRWLEEAATAMGGTARQRRDALLELETSILDRVDEKTREGQIPEEAVRDVLDALGNPAEVGNSFAPERPLLAPYQTRPFLINLVVLFAVHFLLVIGASVAGQTLLVPPLHVAPIANPTHVTELLARALQTLLLDAGLLLCIFALIPRLGGVLRVKAVRPNARRCLEGAFFLGLVLVALNFLRESMLALYLHGPLGTQVVPLVGPGIVDNLIWLNGWIGLAIARELAYARFGESKPTLGLDLLSNALGVFCLLRIVATKALVDLTPAHETLGTSADSLGAMMNMVLTVIAMATAALMTARVARRGFRLALLKN